MAIITINTTALSVFLNRWADGIGETGFHIILLCLGICVLCSAIQLIRIKIG